MFDIMKNDFAELRHIQRCDINEMALRNIIEGGESNTLPFNDFKDEASQIAILGIINELGGKSDELSPILFSNKTKSLIDPKDLVTEIVFGPEGYGLLISSRVDKVINVQSEQIVELLHPKYSFNSKNEVVQLGIFPKLIAKILEARGVKLEVVIPWVGNSVFTKIPKSKNIYETNIVELRNNDTMNMIKLVKSTALAFLGTHDLVHHIAGAKSGPLLNLKQLACEIESAIEMKISTDELVLPYIVGVLFDDLMQPSFYGNNMRIVAIKILLQMIRSNLDTEISANFLSKYFRKLIEHIRGGELDKFRKITFELSLLKQVNNMGIKRPSISNSIHQL